VRIQEFCVGLVTEFSRIRLPRIPSLNGIALSPDQVAEDKKLCDALRVYCVEVAPRADLTKLDLLFSITRERIRGPGQRINYRVWNFFAHILREVPVTDKNGEIKFVPATYPMIYKLITSPNKWLKFFEAKDQIPETEGSFSKSVSNGRSNFSEEERQQHAPKAKPKPSGSTTDNDGVKM